MDYENTFTAHVDYSALLSLARSEYDSFTVVWRSGFQYNDHAQTIDGALEPFLLNQQRRNKWPGTETGGESSLVKEYSVCKQSIEMLAGASSPWDWQAPNRPEDLAFYKKGKVVFASVAHEKMAWHGKP